MEFHTGKGRWHRSSAWAKLWAAGAASGAGGPEKTDTVQLVQVGVPETPLVQGLEVLLVTLLGQEGLGASRDNLKQPCIMSGQAERKQFHDLLGMQQPLCVSASIWVCKGTSFESV